MRVAAFAALLLVVAALLVGTQLERFLNRVEPTDLPEVSDAARALHDGSIVVDLHADSLLFGRDLLQRSDVGHVDLPRLQDGGVAIQFFTAATVAPMGLNIDRNDGDAMDLLTLAGIVQLSPFATRGPLGRALWQAERLAEFAQNSGGDLVPLRSKADLERFLAERTGHPDRVGAVLGIEGAHALEGRPENLDVVFDAGFRMIGLTHFFDNDYAGSAHGVEKGGLTPRGRDLVKRMEARGILLDLAHLSPAATHEVLALATRPVVVSHGGVKGTCDNARNVSDAIVREIARGGGVVGIGYWSTAVCGTRPEDIVRAIRHVVDLVGDEHAALGSDYDGGTTVAFDTAHLDVLSEEMLRQGLSEASIRKILGGNTVRVLRQTLP